MRFLLHRNMAIFGIGFCAAGAVVNAMAQSWFIAAVMLLMAFFNGWLYRTWPR